MASEPYQYRGQGFSLLRDKGRFVLPAAFRRTVRDSSDGKSLLCLDMHHRWPCLIGFGLSHADGFSALLAQEAEDAKQAGKEFDREIRKAQLNGFETAPFDDSGRFVMPGYLLELGEVSDQLYFQGAGDVILIWSPAALAIMGDDWKRAQAACRQFAAEALAKGSKE